jgi:hypothetical protein
MDTIHKFTQLMEFIINNPGQPQHVMAEILGWDKATVSRYCKAACTEAWAIEIKGKYHQGERLCNLFSK